MGLFKRYSLTHCLPFRLRDTPHVRSIFSPPKTTSLNWKKNISSKSQFLKALRGMLNMKIFIFLWYSGMQLIRGIFTVTVEDLEHQLVSSSISFNLGPILKNANVLIAVWWYNDRCALKERFATSCAMQLLFELNATRLCYALIGRISFLMEINFKYLMSFAETSPNSLIKSAIY